ncbi:phage holin family protein [Nigerium massiliense]|uniref:phage holin family protein n=1 Tax=Nigerium massiliense TaxID=1522317 RepID=UPI000693D360|nr:phage holin family protein [Nigerium massiliense]
MPEQQPDVGDVIKDISTDIQTIVKGEIALAKSEIIPQLKGLGIGGGLLGGAAVLGVIALNVLFVCLGFLFTNLFWGHTATPVGAFGWGFLCAVGVYLVLAGILALIGIKKLKFKAPEKTIDEGRKSLSAVSYAASSGMQDVKLIANRGSKQFTTDDQGYIQTVYKGQAKPKEPLPQSFPPVSTTAASTDSDFDHAETLDTVDPVVTGPDATSPATRTAGGATQAVQR